MSQIKTVRRNTKRFRAIMASAYDCDVYSLGNNFCGAPVEPVVMDRYIDGIVKGQLTEGGSSRQPFTLHVHSNLWFNFRASA